MKYLLDTNAFIYLAENDAWSAASQQILSDEDNGVFLSSISVWEICQKHALGKLQLSHDPSRLVPEICRTYGMTFLPFSAQDSYHLKALPLVHKDPFDRMLICQAIEHGLTIVTNDRMIQQYPIKTMW